jgi:hypothetical protein
MASLAALSLLSAGSGAAAAGDPAAMTKPAMTKPAMPMTKPAMAKPMRQGSFRAAEAPVQGRLEIHEQNGERTLVLSDDFRTKAGAPDLKVVFSEAAQPLANSQPPAYPLQAGSVTVLAPLRAASGGQRYRIPASIDLSRQRSVLIWCEQFNATMAWASLTP